MNASGSNASKAKKNNETAIAQMSNVTDAALSHKNDSGSNL